MTLPSFLRWAGRRDARGETAKPQAEASERRSEARWALEGQVRIYWVDAGGEADWTEGDLADVTESLSGFGVEVRRAVPVGLGAWVVSDSDAPVPIDLKTCEPSETGYRLGAAAARSIQRIAGWGTAGVRWVEPDGEVRLAPAVVRNAEDGRLEVNVAGRVPTSTLVLLEGREAACLCLSRSCEPYGDRFLIEVEAVAEAGPVSLDRRAVA